MDDLIKRQDAIDAIKEFQHGAAEWKGEQEERSDIWHRADSAIASAIEIKLRVKKIPSAQKKGHWSLQHGRMRTDYIHSGYMPHKNYCSCCEKDSPYDKQWKFCPNCGADMRGEEDG